MSTDPESGQTIIKGMGELHLEIIVDRMKREFKVDGNVGAPQVAYRETITRTGEIDYMHRKQTGGAGQFARVRIGFEPLPVGSGVEFESRVVGGSVPREFVPGVQAGLVSAARVRPSGGIPSHRFQSDACRRSVARCRFIGDGLRDRRAFGVA